MIEYRIQLLEKELAHAREMQALMRARQDSADGRFERIEGYLYAIAKHLESLAAKVDTIAAAVIRERPNGKQ